MSHQSLPYGAVMTARIQPVQFVSPEVAARVLRVNLNTLYRALRDNDVPHIKIGRDYRIPLEFLGVTPEPVLVRSLNDGMVGQLLLDLRWGA